MTLDAWLPLPIFSCKVAKYGHHLCERAGVATR